MTVNKFKTKFLNRAFVLSEYFIGIGDYHTYSYLIDLEVELSQILSHITNENFWDSLPKILAIDSKYSLLEEYLKFDLGFESKEQELVAMIETDYLTYNKESFGYKMNEECSDALIFYVE